MTHTIRMAIPLTEHRDDLISHFSSAGLELDRDKEFQSLDLFIKNENWHIEVITVSYEDMGTFVERGAVHMGVMSTDLLKESQVDVWRPFTFNFGVSPIILAAQKGQTLARLHARPRLRVATALPRFAREWFTTRGFTVEIVPIHQNPEQSVIMGLADGFVARLENTDKLIANNFRVMEQLGVAELKLIVNNATSSLRREFIGHLMANLNQHRPAPGPTIQIPYDTDDLH